VQSFTVMSECRIVCRRLTLKTSIARSYFPVVGETDVQWEVKPHCILELPSAVPVIVGWSASFRSVGESLVEGRVFGPVIDIKPYYALD
jgi:hypothetical protein